MSLIRIVLAMLALAAASAAAIDSTTPFDDPQLEARFARLTNELRCLVCQNQTIADSNAGLAVDLRKQVREMLDAGASDEEILNFMVARYGNFVRYRPPFEPQTWALWLAPLVLLLVALIVAVRVVSHRARLYREEPAGEDAVEPPGP